MLISGVESTDLFTGPAARPLQIVRVRVTAGGPRVALKWGDYSLPSSRRR